MIFAINIVRGEVMKNKTCKNYKKKTLILFLLFLFLLFGCMNGHSNNELEKQPTSKGKLTIGAKDFTEQSLLLTITSVYLRENGYEVETVSNMSSPDLRSALVDDNIDFYWEYTGTALTLHLNEKGENDPETAYKKVKGLDKENDIVWLEKSEFNNTYAILVREEFSKKHGITTVSDLADYIKNGGELKLASEKEFYKREDGLKRLEEAYDFDLSSDQVIGLDYNLTYKALEDKRADAIVGFVTDGSIHNLNIVALEDDQSFFPAYNVAPVVRKEVIEKFNDLPELLNNIAERLDNETIRTLNYQVDIEHANTLEVSRNWLKEEELID
ncbi:osmoprotectant transport system substrate-binding protein [Alteribacillus bidgolensis]|uniref:Osmoprotectant transport system substrate-binding protein n=2 Tax=Alteribacillus bidgolensis TaxID=930129 RepID=A0A1G8K2K4_9BACI|nr:osmoprotectant transport system substrate-binding protein [Alteribacillus bidgolensis]